MHYAEAPWKLPVRTKGPVADPDAQTTAKIKSNYNIHSVEHAFDILEQFSGNIDELSITELSNRLGLSKNSIFRLLATLESRSYMEQNEHRTGYRLGYKGLLLSCSVVRKVAIQQQAKPVLESLTRESGETSDIAIQRGTQIIYLDAVETSHPVRVIPRTGIMTPSYCTAAGKVLLAGALEREQLTFHPHMEFRRHASKTITDRHEFERHLKMISARGYAIEDEELDAGLRGVAAPICSHGGFLVGAVSVSGPVMRFEETRIRDELVPLVVGAAKEISRRLGYEAP